MNSLEFFSVAEAELLRIDWPDTYFEPGYGSAAACMESGEWEVAIYGDGAILYPYIKRPIDESLGLKGRFDLVSPYGYSGAWARPDTSLAQWRSFRKAMRESAPSRGFIAEFFRLGSLVPGRENLLGADTEIHGTRFNDTVVINLSDGLERYWTQSAGRSRTAIRKAQRLGYEGHIREAHVSDLTTGSPFRLLYEQTMQRLQAADVYLLPDEYYSDLLGALGENLTLCQVRDSSGDVGSAALFMRSGKTLHYHLAGSAREAARDGANNLLIHTAIDWAIKHGIQRLHLGGGTRPNDGLFRFKQGFSRNTLEYWLAKSVLQKDEYLTLCKARAQLLGVNLEQLDAAGFFPTYRASSS